MSFLRAGLYWAHLDKRRPVLVISIDARNERAGDLLVIPATTRLREAPTHVILRAGEGGLASRTSLQCEQVTNLPKSALESDLIGRLDPKRIAAVERALMRAVGIAVREPD